MEWYSSPPAVWMAELLMGTALPYLNESQYFQARYYLMRLQHRQLGHVQSTCTF